MQRLAEILLGLLNLIGTIYISQVKNYIFHKVRFLVKQERILTDTAILQGGYDTCLRLKARYENGKILALVARSFSFARF